MKLLLKEEKARILSNIIIQGGNSLVPGFDQRIKRELITLNTFDANINIVNEWKPDENVRPQRQVDPLQGAIKLVHTWQQKELDFRKLSITKKEYDEYGSHYLKEHFLSNALYGQKINVGSSIFE